MLGSGLGMFARRFVVLGCGFVMLEWGFVVHGLLVAGGATSLATLQDLEDAVVGQALEGAVEKSTVQGEPESDADVVAVERIGEPVERLDDAVRQLLRGDAGGAAREPGGGRRGGAASASFRRIAGVKLPCPCVDHTRSRARSWAS